MNNFEKKAFKFETLSAVYDDLTRRQQYYMTIKRDDEGHPIEDERGNWTYEEPDDEYQKERLAVLRELTAEFEKWALK